MRGFVLAELIIVMALIGVFTSISLIGFSSLEEYFLSRSAKNEVMTILDRTRNAAISMKENDGWSFRFEGNEAMVFKGNDYSLRDSSFDELYELPKNTSGTTTGDIYFEPMTGYSSFASVTLDTGTSTIEISVSDNGIIK
jgi:prepilin-type N-terminal cleavage/methylation domain-containing protein